MARSHECTVELVYTCNWHNGSNLARGRRPRLLNNDVRGKTYGLYLLGLWYIGRLNIHIILHRYM